jgi:hypothetical protein
MSLSCNLGSASPAPILSPPRSEGAYVGLTSRRHASGEVDWTGRINALGSNSFLAGFPRGASITERIVLRPHVSRYRLRIGIICQQATLAPQYDAAIEKFARATPQALVRTLAIAAFLSLSEHETFALLIYWIWSGGTGKPAVVDEGRAESCPSGFSYGSRRSS